jgi:hypothetical protein
MAICKACGRDIAADMMFCPYCGTKRTLDDTGMPAEDVLEQKIGVIPYVKGKGRLEGTWTVIVSSRRFVFAKALESDEKGESMPKGVGLGLLAKRGPDSGCGLTYAQRYQEMTPDEALKESPDNFQIDVKDVVQSSMSQDSEDRYGIKMRLNDGELVFSMPQQHDHRDYLRTVLGDKVAW